MLTSIVAASGRGADLKLTTFEKMGHPVDGQRNAERCFHEAMAAGVLELLGPKRNSILFYL